MSLNPLIKKYFTKGDIRTAISDTLVDANGTAIDLSASTVVFRMVLAADDSVKVAAGAVTIDDATAGEVSYPWDSADVDTAGKYFAWWIVTTGGETEHFPGDGKKLLVEFVEDY